MTPRAGLLLLLWSAAAAAQSPPGGFDQAFDGDERPWREIEAKLPAYPLPENLVKIDAGATASSRYYVDTASLSVDPDGVVRYSVVVKSAYGAESVSYEGIRCDTRERRSYAFGRPDGSWSRARSSRWERIQANLAQTRYQMTLYGDYFCPEGRIAGDRKEVLDGLRRGQNWRLDDFRQ
ncbi:MAG TPA: CNP1-like family protein [Burkholderiales bacterium]